ncbi:alpha-1,2-mannosidase, putative [Tangfeifania diversioriginum]|uniref:Alpha-1,2-mannosidase, putative n=1 Tax=Tangfeifania diversioriginum TaxID=1168035 RepID=A0A1M6GC30_9BACT|nr:GH92 family glycosyl hydrolase [Tangfeifania diversioriginum]SHJ07479.1 alpha-1,2-mannosidase, putative [Tangfeifania diversioriginum]
MKQLKSFSLLILLLVLNGYTSFLTAQSKNPVDYVNPFLGTDFFGHTFPGASLPNAMVHVSPDTGTEGWTHCAGYTWSASSIMGFSHTHWSGVGMVDGGDILFMPAVGNKLQIVPGTDKDPDAGYRSRFDHNRESASPGYYSVFLKDHGIEAELTTTPRVAFHRYTFPESDNAKIIVDLGHQIGEGNENDVAEIRIINNHRIEGEKIDGPGKVYFVAEFSKPFLYYGTFDSNYATPESDAGIFPYKSAERGRRVGAFVRFNTSDKEEVLVKVAISYTGIEGARKNMEAELPHWDFDRVKNEARDIWNNELSKLKIDGATDNQKEIFYTALYRSLLAQYISQDVDGNYFGADGKIQIAKDYNFYGSFSCWDTYRSQHPLLTLVAPEHVNDYIKSIVAKTKQYGWLPGQHFQNVFGEGMVGDHLVPVVVDAYRKGFRDYDVDFIYHAMRTKALEFPKPPVSVDAARSGLKYTNELGYIPANKVTESVPKTMEFAYDDWCIAQMAKALKKEGDYNLLMQRAENYKNVWDEETAFMRPRMANGSWLEALNGKEQEIVNAGDHSYYKYFDPLLVGRRPNRHYTESNAWQYIWSVQHDVPGLINLFGSTEEFVEKLDTFFDMSPLISPPKYVGVVGTIGQYVHGNQPSHHVAYLYNYAGQPWKTQFRARQIAEQLYRPGPGGLCGNEDMGSLSSWYVLSAMGIYPVTPGNPVYAIGSPLFEKITLETEKGATFAVIARNNSAENIYIQKGTLNGKPFNRTWISHEEIVNGGVLEFEMGPEPNKKWGN